MKILLTCEHGGFEIPSKYESYFRGAAAILKSHRGYDPGALQVYKTLKPLADFSASETVSRLLIEINRSLHHPDLFSEFSKPIAKAEKKELIETLYQGYRQPIIDFIEAQIAKKESVFHFSIHSFTSSLNGEERNNQIGLLYDSKNLFESELSKSIKQSLQFKLRDYTIRFNYPYLGSADGFTTFLRKKFSANYCGIEIELNQGLLQNGEFPENLKTSLYQVLKEIKENSDSFLL